MNKINIQAPISHQTSYGESAISLVIELERLGIEIALFPIGGLQNSTLDPKITYNHDIIKTAINRGLNGQFSKESNSLRIYHAFSMAECIGRLRYGFPIFELSKFSIAEENHLKQLDHIFVTSKWAKTIVDDQIKIPTSIVPLGVDSNIFKPTKRTHTTTKFCICGKIEYRKSTKELIDGFCETFNQDDDVELYLCIANIFNTKEENLEWTRYIQSRKISSKIFLLPRFPSSLDVADVLSSCDCLLSMSRGEGWSLPALQMLSTGGHVIATNNTAQTEFLNRENSYLIETPDMEMAWDGKFFLGNGFENEKGKWYSIGSEQKSKLSEYMKMIHKKKQSGELGINLNGLETAKRFSWENSAKSLVRAIS